MKTNLSWTKKMIIKYWDLGRFPGRNVKNVVVTDQDRSDYHVTTTSQKSKPVSANFPSSANDDPGLLSTIRSLKSKVTGMIIASVPSETSPPPSLTNEDKQFITDEARVMIDRIKTSSASLIDDLKLMNKKLSMFPWLIESENFRVTALRKLRMLGNEEETVGVLVRECKARLGEREMLNSPGVRILSLDGGGMRGVATLLMLEELEKITGAKTHQMFDLIVGTSTGAVIASLVGISCMEAKEGLDLYMEMGGKIFERSLVGGVGGLIQNQSYYDQKILEEVLRNYAGDSLLFNSSWSPGVPAIAMVSSIVTNTIQPHIFSNYLLHPSIKPPFPHTTTTPLFQAIIASCAAPGYFSHVVVSGSTHVDGAVVANNPAQLALLESKLLWPKEKLQCLASFGSGQPGFQKLEEKNNITTKDVLTRSLDALADTETAHQVLKHFLDSERYFRLSPPLQNIVELNEVREYMLDQLIKETRRYIRNNNKLFTDLAETVMEPPSTVDRLMRSCRKI